MIIYAKIVIQNSASCFIKDDLKHISSVWYPHFNNYHYEGAWTVFPLRSPNGADTSVPGILKTDTFKDHPNMADFPSIKKFINLLQCEVMSVRLLNLASGSVIKQHRDNELSFEKGEARLHIPIITNPKVEFYVNDERVLMGEGECWYINANLPHRVTNNGTTDRIHLVIDCKVNEWLKERIESSSKIAHAPDFTPKESSKIIKALREQNTEMANQIADKMQMQYE